MEVDTEGDAFFYVFANPAAAVAAAVVALAVDDLDATLAQLKHQGIEPEREPYRVRKGRRRRARWTGTDGSAWSSR